MSTRVPIQPDLFGTDDPLIGLRVRLDRAIDQSHPCHGGIAEICVDCGPSAYALLCATCGQHRGWLPKTAAAFLRETTRVFSVPTEPLIYRGDTAPPARRTESGKGGPR